MSNLKPNKLTIGLTGGIGSGKSAAMKCFQNLGVPCIDADHVARKVVQPGTSALKSIASRFGITVLGSGGELNRSALRTIIFHADEERIWLENLLHPLINQEIRKWLNEQNTPYCVLCSPLLLETKQYQLVDRILLIDVPVEIQIQRTIERDSCDKSQVEAIIANQLSRQKKLERADDIICNERDLTYLQQTVTKLHSNYLDISRQVNKANQI